MEEEEKLRQQREAENIKALKVQFLVLFHATGTFRQFAPAPCCMHFLQR